MAKKRNIKKAEEVELDDELPFSPEGIEIIGNYPTLQRVKTGLFSLDMAMSSGGEIGLPLRVILEFYGYTNSGKSTLAYYLAGKVSQTFGCEISVADLEMLDTRYIPKAVGVSGFKGKINIMDVSKDNKPMTHEEILMNMAKSLVQEEVTSAIWDSVGATKSMVEMNQIKDPKAQFGEAFMGKDAKLVTQVVSALRTVLTAKETPSTAIAINHVHGIMGGRGHTTKGGERLKYLAGVRAMIWTAESFYSGEDESTQPLGFLAHGQIEKLRFGGKGREFKFYIVPGFGVHAGVTAMMDCLDLGLCEKDKTGRIRLNDQNLGYMKADLLTYAAQGKFRKFYPFIDLLETEYRKAERGDPPYNF